MTVRHERLDISVGYAQDSFILNDISHRNRIFYLCSLLRSPVGVELNGVIVEKDWFVDSTMCDNECTWLRAETLADRCIGQICGCVLRQFTNS